MVKPPCFIFKSPLNPHSKVFAPKAFFFPAPDAPSTASLPWPAPRHTATFGSGASWDRTTFSWVISMVKPGDFHGETDILEWKLRIGFRAKNMADFDVFSEFFGVLSEWVTPKTYTWECIIRFPLKAATARGYSQFRANPTAIIHVVKPPFSMVKSIFCFFLIG